MVLDFALPPRCPACGCVMGEQGGFCHDCWGKIDFLFGPSCSRCGVPFDVDPAEEGASLCGACMDDPPRWTSARAVLAYGDIARHIVMRLKYGRRTGLAKLMAQGMNAHLSNIAAQEKRPMLVMPVPLHRWRLWERGFNQSALIARHLGKASGLPVDVLSLKRTKATKSLRAMNPEQRRKEVKGAFAIDAKDSAKVKGKAVILIDDVHTSGATVHACADVLMKQGAVAVHILCWARVVSGRGDYEEKDLQSLLVGGDAHRQ